MSEPSPTGTSRREFLQNTGRAAAATALVSRWWCPRCMPPRTTRFKWR